MILLVRLCYCQSFIFSKVFGGHMSVFWATGTLFWISDDVSSGFQSQSGLPYSHCRGEHNVWSPRSTSAATLADLLAAGMQPVLSPHIVAEVRLPGFELVLSEYLWARRSTNWAKPGPVYCQSCFLNVFCYCNILNKKAIWISNCLLRTDVVPMSNGGQSAHAKRGVGVVFPKCIAAWLCKQVQASSSSFWQQVSRLITSRSKEPCRMGTWWLVPPPPLLPSIGTF